MAEYDETFYKFVDDSNPEDNLRYVQSVYFHRARKDYEIRNKPVTLLNVADMNYMFKELDEYQKAFIGLYSNGFLLQVIAADESRDLDLDLLKDVRDEHGSINYHDIISCFLDSVPPDEHGSKDAFILPDLFFVLTAPKTLDDTSVTDENLVELYIPIVLSGGNDHAFFSICNSKYNGTNYSFFRLFPEVADLVNAISLSIYDAYMEGETYSGDIDSDDGDDDYESLSER